MKPPIPPTESIALASSETSTTPTAVGEMSDTGQKQEPAPALMRERKRRKTAMTQIKALESLLKDYQEKEARLERANEDLVLRNENLTNQVKDLSKKLNFLAFCKVKQDGAERLLEINLTLRIDPRQLEKGSSSYRYYLAEQVMAQLHAKMSDTAIKALVTSPLVLLDTPAAKKVYYPQRRRWIHELMFDPQKISMVAHLGGPEKIEVLWDEIFEAIKKMGMSIPPDTEIRWVK